MPDFIYGQWVNDPLINTTVYDAPNGASGVQTAVTSDGKIYTTWWDNTIDNVKLYLQLFSAAGEKLWPGDGIIISDHPQVNFAGAPRIKCDKENNAVIIFPDMRNGDNATYFAYKIDANGNFLWGNDGITISDAIGALYYDDNLSDLCITSDNSAVFVTEFLGQNERNAVFCQKIKADGSLAWNGINGVVLSDGSANLCKPKVISSDNNSLFVAYMSITGELYSETINLYVQKLDENGTSLFPSPKAITNAGGIPSWDNFFAKGINNNDMMVVWRDGRNNSSSNGYVQYVASDGSMPWAENGVAVCSNATINLNPMAVGMDNQQNIFVAWLKNNNSQNDRCLAIQKISPNGSLLWGDGGKELTPWLGDLGLATITDASVTSDTIIVTYTCYNEQLLYLKTSVCGLHSEGDFLWESQSVDIATSQTHKSTISTTYVFSNQVVTTWIDGVTQANIPNKVKAQNLNMDGTMGTIVGIDESQDNILFQPYPNPVNDVLCFGKYISVYKLINSQGKVVKGYSGKPVNKVIVNDLQPGLYFILYQKEKYWCSKILKL